MNALTGKVVAEYTGRPQITEEYFEQQRLLMLYYGIAGGLNYENNKKGLYGHYLNKNSLHLLCETPEILRDVANITISRIGNKRFGTSASVPVNNYGLQLTKKWLLAPAYHQPENAEEPVLNLHTIRSTAFIEELIDYHSKGNFDRISAFGMLLILREDIYKLIQSQMSVKQQSLALDKFWTKSLKRSNSYTPTKKLIFPTRN